jgi:hypothetical protein
LPVWIGVDAGYKHDYSAIVVVSYAEHRVRLVYHRVFKPLPHSPLDFEQTIERTLLDLSRRFAVCKILYDPYQMVALAQRLQKCGLPLQEFRQSPPNLTLVSQNLFELLTGHNIVLYPEPEMRQAAAHAIAIETTGGWRIAKERTSHRIDVIVALAQAAYAAVKMRPPEEPPIVMPWATGKNMGEIGAGVDFMPAPAPPAPPPSTPPATAPPVASASAPAPPPLAPADDSEDVPALVKRTPPRPLLPPAPPPQPTPEHLLKDPNSTPANPGGYTPNPWASPFGGNRGGINSPNFSMRDRWSVPW